MKTSTILREITRMIQNYKIPFSAIKSLGFLFANLVIGLSVLLIITKNYSEVQLQPTLYYSNDDFNSYHAYDVDSVNHWTNRFSGYYALNPKNNAGYTILPRSDKPSGSIDLFPSPDGSLIFALIDNGQFLLETKTLNTISQLSNYDASDEVYRDFRMFAPRETIIRGNSWSPDGEKLVYVLYPSRDNYEDAGLWITNKDGSNQRRVLQSNLKDGGFYLPAFLGWFSDGRLIISGKMNEDNSLDNNVYLVSDDGLTWEKYLDDRTYINWARDNQHYLKIDPWRPSAMLFSNASETNGINIIPNELEIPNGWVVALVQDNQSTWSPDSQWVALEVEIKPVNEEYFWSHKIIYLISADNKIRINLNKEIYPYQSLDRTILHAIGWSPDGSLFAVEGIVPRSGALPDCQTFDCFVTDAVYIYSIKDRASYSVPVPINSNSVVNGPVKGWWPMVKQGPLGLSLPITLFLVENRNGLIVGVVISLLALIGVIMTSTRSNN